MEKYEQQQQKFYDACEMILEKGKAQIGIGTLSEKTLHAVLKNYYEPNIEKQEIKIGRYYADIFREAQIIEIQTRHFNKLRQKLAYFLEQYAVKIVYPIPYQKWIYWIDEQTGEISGGRRSPKKGTIYEALIELYKIKMFLRHENLHLDILLIDMEEYRLLNGWSKDRKKGAHRMERIPTALVEVLHIQRLEDYRAFIPESLSDPFTCKEFAEKAKISLRLAQTSVNILLEVNVIERIGKQGRAYLYKRV